MNHWHFYLTAMLLLGVAQSNSAESRVALVNGNAAYPDTPLKSSVKDARVISKTPRGLGFACRNKPFQRRFRRASRGLVAVDAATGTRIAYGAAPATVACDGDGKGGIYTGAQLRALRGPGLTAEAVFKQVRTEWRDGDKRSRRTYNTFYHQRHLLKRPMFKELRAASFEVWQSASVSTSR